MARLMLIGEAAQVIATCRIHVTGSGMIEACGWTERYDDMGDATEYAAGHADRGTR